MRHEDVAAAARPSAPPDFAAAWQRALLQENDNAPPAIVTPDGRLTRRELNGRAEELAGELHSIGLRPGDRVATLLPPGAALAVAALAIWRTGGVYMPLDPTHPEARNREFIRRLGAAALIGPDGQAGPISPGGDGAAADASATGASAAPDADYVFFTSGSTGEPKNLSRYQT